MHNKWNYLCIILAAVCWGTIGVFFNQLLAQGLSRLEIVALRVGIALFFLVLYLLWKDKQLLWIDWRDSWIFIGTGLCSLLFFNYCYFTAIELTTLSVAAVLLYTSPIIVMLLSVMLFHEQLTMKKIVVVLMTFTGCIMVTGMLSGGQQRITTVGILFGLGSGLGYALYSIFGTYGLRKYHSMTVTVYTFGFAMLGVIPLCGGGAVFLQLGNSQTLIYALGLGIVACLFPYLLYTKGLTGVKASQAAVLATLEPVVATMISVAVYHEILSLEKVSGMALIVAAIIILNIQPAKLIRHISVGRTKNGWKIWR